MPVSCSCPPVRKVFCLASQKTKETAFYGGMWCEDERLSKAQGCPQASNDMTMSTGFGTRNFISFQCGWLLVSLLPMYFPCWYRHPHLQNCHQINHQGCSKCGKPELSHGQPSVGTCPAICRTVLKDTLQKVTGLLWGVYCHLWSQNLFIPWPREK